MTLFEVTSEKDALSQMIAKLSGIVPAVELRAKAEIVYEILRLKKERGAIILGHNYMEPILYHTVPDVTGDSLELSRKAAETDRDPIIFCGVKFMAETAKILNPSKKVLLPAREAGCSLAASITGEDVRKLKAQFPGVPVVTYINTYADVKAETDICCTSGNAAKVVNSLSDKQIIFLPDEYLARNIAHETGKEIIFPKFLSAEAKKKDNVLIGWHGRCEVHDQFTVDDIKKVKEQFPEVVVIAHPECSPEVVAASDFSGSTSRMIKYIQDSPLKQYMLLTECSMADNIAAENRDKEMIRLCSIRCPHMNQITLEDTLRALREDVYEITLDTEVIEKAKRSLERMIEIY
jgi:quinolinate synthase